MYNASGKVPVNHSCLFNKHLVSALFLSLGDSGDKKDHVTALMKLNLNERRGQSIKKHINKKRISYIVSSMQKIYKGEYDRE